MKLFSVTNNIGALAMTVAALIAVVLIFGCSTARPAVPVSSIPTVPTFTIRPMDSATVVEIHRQIAVRRDSLRALAIARAAAWRPGAVFFEQNADTLKRGHKGTLTRAARVFAGRWVTVRCYASMEGPKAFNEGLSMRRAQRVRAALIAAGQPADRLLVVAGGPTDQFGGPEQNRRCEIKEE